MPVPNLDHMPDRPARDSLPPYKRIADDLKRKIESGELGPGEQVGPVPELVSEYQVTRNTVLRAIKILRDAELVIVQPGWGVFVSDR